MDLRMRPMVTLLAVFVFVVVSADELVLQLNGELGSFPESMILSKIQMGVIDPNPIVNERGLRYFVQIARNNVVVYPHGIQTIVPIGRKRYFSQRLFHPRTTISPSQKSNSRNTWPRTQNSGDSVQALDPDRRMLTASSDRNTQTGSLKSVKPPLNQSRQASTDESGCSASPSSRDQQNRRKLVDVLKSGTQRETNNPAMASKLPERITMLSGEQAPSITETREVVRGIVIEQVSNQHQRHYQLQRQLQNSRPSQTNDQHIVRQLQTSHEAMQHEFASRDQSPDFQRAQYQQNAEPLIAAPTSAVELTTEQAATTTSITTASSSTTTAETSSTTPDAQNGYQSSD
ncbi:hypothetical protein Btru_033466 [Bulinus truncatus]|nr:hypothetical protein Btru_033466 [Bulinus truncatus]